MSKQSQLDTIKQRILDNKVCRDLAAQATQLVFGAGNPDADIVFVGEAPGKNEDLRGEPFVGAAGKFLDEMLESINLKRQDIYITNIVKYRPPNNRDPLPEEKAAFFPYLKAQIEVIQPKLLIPLGSHSMNCFLPGFQITAVHGQPKRVQWTSHGLKGVRSEADGTAGESKSVTQQSAMKQGTLSGSAGNHDLLTLIVLPLYHPAAALYNGSLRQTLLDDFARIPQIISQVSTKELDTKQENKII